MANPGYPMQPMQPMQPPMQPMRPSGQPMMPASRGTPKAVPIIVSAGLAVGVFCGLLFGLGTGEEEAKASTPTEKKFVGTKIDGAGDTPTVEGGTGPAPPKSVSDGTLVTGTMKEPKGSAPGSAATPATGSPTITPPPTIKVAKLIFVIKPDSIKDATITVEGAAVSGDTIDVPLGDQEKKKVTVLVKAPGFKDFEKELEIEEGELKIEYELQKARGSSGGTSTPKRPPPPGGTGTKKGGGKKGGGGLIDI